MSCWLCYVLIKEVRLILGLHMDGKILSMLTGWLVGGGFDGLEGYVCVTSSAQ